MFRLKRLQQVMACFLVMSSAAMGSAPAYGAASETSPPADSEKPSKHHKGDKAKDSDKDAVTDRSAAACISWINPLVKTRMAMLCIHGLGLYSGAYQSFGMRMAARGIATYAIDVRGFGSWMKSPGHEQVDFDGCLRDVKTTLEAIRRSHPGLPVFLLGESMGGAIALRAASMYPDLIEGLISSVPAGERFQQKKTELNVAVHFIKGKNKQFDIGSKIVQQATQNPQEQDDWSNNPLDRMDLSAKELMQFQKFMNENHDAAKGVTDDPVLFVQGTQDKLVKPEGTWDLFNELVTPQKYFLAVPSEHLIFEEGQMKTQKFDANVAQIASNWMLMVAALPQNPGSKNNVLDQGVARNLNQSESAQAAEASALNAAVEKLIKGQYQDALTALQAVIKKEPQNAEAHYWLGIDYSKLRRPQLARAEMVRALTLGHGSVHALQANNFLLANQTEPEETSADTTPADPLLHGLANGTPTVVAFYTAWCDQCDPVEGFFDQAKNMFGNKVKLMKIDVEDTNNEALVKACKVGPVPTFVFIRPDGKIVTTTIGRTSFINFAKGVSSLVH